MWLLFFWSFLGGLFAYIASAASSALAQASYI